MIPKFLKNTSENSLVLFDMDGVCAEYIAGEGKRIVDDEKNIYLNKRPIKTIIKVAKQLSKQKNITVGILSSCEYENQKEEKIKWLGKYMPFLKKENIHIIVWESDDKDYRVKEKGKQILSIKNFSKVYLIDDKHSIISATNLLIPGCAHHLSEFID